VEEPFRKQEKKIANDEQADDRQFMTQAQLTYFDRSRRKFLKLSGLALAGLFLPGAIFKDAVASNPTGLKWLSPGSAPDCHL
jgi:hypothetical protein